MPQHGFRHRHEGVQVERASPAQPDPGGRQFLAAARRVAQLAGQDAGAAEAEAARRRIRRSGRRRGRDQQMEQILLHAVEIELPGDRPSAGRRCAERGQVSRRTGHPQPVI